MTGTSLLSACLLISWQWVAGQQQSESEFRSGVNMVQVPVIVLDRNGVAVRDLHKDDFEVFDKGKKQTISSFSVEREEKSPRDAGRATPVHFIAYFIDDVSIAEASDLGRIRDALAQRLDAMLPGDRGGIFTSSCRAQVDFTDDRTKLQEAVATLRARAIPVCRASKSETLQITVLDAIVARMASLPAQRAIILVSPGFHVGHDRSFGEIRLIEDATRARVLINALDVGEVTSGNPIETPDQPRMPQWQSASDDIPQTLTSNPLVLTELAHGTGGRYVMGGNDYASGFRKLATPSYFYVLGFVPQGKPDRSYHQLKVKLVGTRKVQVQSRNSYYAIPAPGGGETPAPEAPLQPEVLVTTASTPDAPIGAPARQALPAGQPEIVQRSEPATFKSRVNLVQVPVVVRNGKGDAIGSLSANDFQLFDNGKRQQIAKFSMQEIAGPTVVGQIQNHEARPVGAPNENHTSAPSSPDHFVAFVFDDIHIRFLDLPQVREAVRRFVRSSLRPGDRVALYTASGRIGVEFTDRPESLDEALLRIRPNPISDPTPGSCLGVSYFQAVQIAEQVSLHPILPDDIQRSPALKAAAFDTAHCIDSPNPGASATPQAIIPSSGITGDAQVNLQKVRDAFTSGKQESRALLTALRTVVQRMAVMPGQRSIVLVSPGFFVSTDLQDEASTLIDLAVRSSVIISAIDARGVWTNPVFDASMSGAPPSGDVIAFIEQDHAALGEELRTLAEGTGGMLNVDNDFEGGVRRAAAVPEYVYVLGFSPQNLKTDGSFHRLKVTLNTHERVSLQVRRGYYAPRGENPEDIARQEIENAVFSRDELHDLPVELRTTVSKAGDGSTLDVTAVLNIALLRYRDANARHADDVSIVWTLFDGNGGFLSGTQTLVQLRLKDETVGQLADKPTIAAKASFSVKAGDYLVRMVARDAEGQQMAAENATTHVP